MRTVAILACLLALAACSKTSAPEGRSFADPKVEASLARPASPTEAMAADAAGAAAPESAPRAAMPAPTAPMLAYTYGYEVEAPAARVPSLLAAHEKACADAGPAICQMTGSSVNREGRDQVRATLSLRATPRWIARFRTGLPEQVDKAGGKVVGASTDSEDLTRQIVDTEAALRAKTTLRDRLQAILATRPGKVSELLEVEQALATVQGEIDASQSELAVMRTRIATSAVTLNYSSISSAAPDGVGNPLGEALKDVLRILVTTLAVMVRTLAWLAPWVLVGALVLWLARKPLGRMRGRRRARRAAVDAGSAEG